MSTNSMSESKSNISMEAIAHTASERKRGLLHTLPQQLWTPDLHNLSQLKKSYFRRYKKQNCENDFLMYKQFRGRLRFGIKKAIESWMNGLNDDGKIKVLDLQTSLRARRNRRQLKKIEDAAAMRKLNGWTLVKPSEPYNRSKKYESICPTDCEDSMKKVDTRFNESENIDVSRDRVLNRRDDTVPQFKGYNSIIKKLEGNNSSTRNVTSRNDRRHEHDRSPLLEKNERDYHTRRHSSSNNEYYTNADYRSYDEHEEEPNKTIYRIDYGHVSWNYRPSSIARDAHYSQREFSHTRDRSRSPDQHGDYRRSNLPYRREYEW